MVKLITIKAPALDRESGKIVTVDVCGTVANLTLGETPIKCLIQYENDKPAYLTHFATGFKFPRSFADQGVTDAMRNGMRISGAPRRVAQSILDHLVMVYTAEKILAKIAAVAPINEKTI